MSVPKETEIGNIGISKNKVKKKIGELSKEELIDYVHILERHVKQLQNIISKDKTKKEECQKRKERQFDFNKYNTRHVALKFLYLGWDYQGLAAQEDTCNTIEAVLFEALMKTKLVESRETSNYHRCGRTDKGVSAFSQVISIDLRTNLLEGPGVKERQGGTAVDRPEASSAIEINYLRIINAVLPNDIRVIAWCPVDINFSARFNCFCRTYKYFFPLGNMDLNVMREAGNKLIGSHDFRNLCKMDVGNGVVHFIRNIQDVSLNTLCDSTSNGYQVCELTIKGNAFLWHQIRCIVAILFLIGEKNEEPGIIDSLLDVAENTRKPQYSMGSELPLVLFDCQFEDVEWIFDKIELCRVIKNLQSEWTKLTVKSIITKSMLTELESEYSKEEDNETILKQADCLIPGCKQKVYKPLLKRQKCDTLDERIQHFAKKQIIDSTVADT